MKKQVLLLNQDNTPLNIITISKAFKLLSKDKVWIDENSSDYYELVSVSKIVKIPKVLILKYYVKLPYKRVTPNRMNILRRDNYCCQYCGMDLCPKTATLDHVIPRSKGGSSTWSILLLRAKIAIFLKETELQKRQKWN